MEIKLLLPFLAFVIGCLAFLTLFLVFRVKNASPKTLIFKTLASLCFVLGGVYACWYFGLSKASTLVLCGLLFALIGDIVLDLYVMDNKNQTYLNSGLVVFSLSSIFYLVAVILFFSGLEKFVFMLIGSIIVAILIATIILLIAKPLKLDFSKFKVQVFVYSFLVSLVAVLSLAVCFFVNGFAIFAVGTMLVLISDMVLSFTYFGEVKHQKTLVVINHVLYYIGELFIMAYLFFFI